MDDESKTGLPLAVLGRRYLKSPENKKRWVIDPYAAGIVQDIFRMCLEGKGQETIARILQERKVLIPMAYWYSLGQKRAGKQPQADPYKWGKTSIAKILANQEYCGDIINFKTYSKSFKNKARIENPEENWVVFKNVHEPIIDRETFELVQKLVGKTKRRSPKIENGEKSMFSDLLYCADCGHKLWHHINTNNHNIHFFSCSNYKTDTRGSCETRHYIRADAIEQVVMWELQRMVQFLKNDEAMFAALLAQKTNADMAAEKKHLEAERQKATARNNKVAELFEKLYEDNVSGKVTDEWFMQLSHKYEVERMELKSKIAELHNRILELDSMKENKDQFIHAIRKFMEMQTLTAPLLRELIDHIDVYETEGTGKNRTQRIMIHYKFVGVIEIPDSGDNYTADTRKGVAVEYVTKSAWKNEQALKACSSKT